MGTERKVHLDPAARFTDTPAMLRKALGLVVCLAACAGNSEAPFSSGLDPLEENIAPPPAAQPGDPHPEALGTESGKSSEHHWMHARGYIHAPLAQVRPWAEDPDVCRDPVPDEWTVEYDVEPEYDTSFVFHYKERYIITVEFDVTWRFGLIEGTPEDPEVVAGRFQKTWGTDYIRKMEGSVVLRRVSDDVTEIELIEFLDARSSGVSEIRTYLETYYGNLLAAVHAE